MRSYLALFSLTACALLPFACTAELEEGCLSGACTEVQTTGEVGGGSNTGGMGGMGGSAPVVGDFPCPVFQVILDKCSACHQSPPKGGAPFPILTYEDTQKLLGQKTVLQRMAEVIQPNGVPHMPFGSAPQLTQAEFTTLNDWLTQGATPEPEGMGCECPGQGCMLP